MIDWWTELWVGGLLPAILVAAGIVVATHVLARRRVPHPDVRRTLLALVHGPVTVAIVGFAVYVFAQAAEASGLLTVPSYLSPGNIRVLVELAVLSSVTTMVAQATRRHFPYEHYPNSRYLLYGVYAAAVLAVIAIVLTSPETPRFSASVWQVIGFFTGVLATYFVIHIVDLTLRRYLQTLTDREPRYQTIYSFLRRFTMGVVALIGVAVATFASFPDLAAGLASLILAAGFVSIVVGLAAQTSISNLIAGALVSLTQPFRIGDAVVFGGEYCFVEDIRLTYAVLRVWDNRRLMVPNSLFMSQLVVNYTIGDATMLVPLVMRISYDSDMERAMKIMQEEARAHPNVLPIGDLPNVVVMDYTDQGVSLRVLSRAADQGVAFQMERDLLRSIRRRFDAEGIRLAVPYREVLMRGPEPPAPRPGRRRENAPGSSS